MPEPQEADRPNPFSGPLSPDADSVVQMFLMNQQTNRGQQPVQRPIFVTGLSATSPGGPGKILFCSFGGILLGHVEKYPNYVEKELRYRVFFMVFFSTFNVAIT